MSDLTLGMRCGPFVILKDEEGLRHAVRQAAILAISDTDDTSSSTVIQLAGNRTAVIRCSLDRVLEWFT